MGKQDARRVVDLASQNGIYELEDVLGGDFSLSSCGVRGGYAPSPSPECPPVVEALQAGGSGSDSGDLFLWELEGPGKTPILPAGGP